MKIFSAFFSGMLCCCLWAAPQPRSEQVFSKTIQPCAYYPTGVGKGYYYPGEKPHFVLELRNTASEPVEVSIGTVVSDFDGKCVCTVPEIKRTLAGNKVTATEFDLPEFRDRLP